MYLVNSTAHTRTRVHLDTLSGQIDDLKFLIGPKLYEANWLELSRAGALASVQCVEVHCPMTKEFYAEYLVADMSRKTQLYIMNPCKFWCTQVWKGC